MAELTTRNSFAPERGIAGLVIVGLMASGSAQAHLVSSGVGPFYDGVAHFLVSPDDLVVVVALSLFAGLSSRPAAKRLVRALPVGWFSGMIGGLWIQRALENQWLTAATMVGVGLLLASKPNVSLTVPPIIACAIGLVHGFLNGQAMSQTNTSYLAGIGIVAGVGLVALCVAAFATTMRVQWQIIAARTLGSWIAAVGLLMFGWIARGPSL